MYLRYQSVYDTGIYGDSKDNMLGGCSEPLQYENGVINNVGANLTITKPT
jgi:hypothetical protein